MTKRVNKLSGEEDFFRTLDWAKHYVDYRTGLIEHTDLDEDKVFSYVMHLNDITEEGKYPI